MKITNKQGRKPNPLVHHHEQGLTCDCKQCGQEFTQYHNAHVFCRDACRWEHNGVGYRSAPCQDCGRTLDAPANVKNHTCRACRMLKDNPNRRDVAGTGACVY